MLPFTGHQEPERRRGIIMTMLFGRKSKTEAQVFFEETYPLPLTAIAIGTLLVANVAMTLAAVAALG
jgi:hypothetical protein